MLLNIVNYDDSNRKNYNNYTEDNNIKVDNF